MLAKFSGLNRKGQYRNFIQKKKKICVVFTYSIKRVREILKFHVAVVRRRLRNVQKGVMHVRSCKPTALCRSRCPRRRRWLGSPLV